MTVAFTPGPWSNGKNIPIRAVDQEALGYSIIFVNTDSAARKDVARANARLIAAAPELLEALVGLDDAYCRAGADLTRGERHEDRMRLIAARAAIAKATGATT